MSSGAEVVAPGIGLPEGGDTERENLWQRAIGNVRSGNLGVLPVVLAELGIVTYFAFTATNFFTAPNFVNVILQMPLTYPIERSISPSSRTKTTPYAIIVVPAIWRMTLTKFGAVKKFVAVKLK